MCAATNNAVSLNGKRSTKSQGFHPREFYPKSIDPTGIELMGH